MGTTVEFNVASAGKNTPAMKEACDAAEERIAELDKMLSIFDSASMASRINNDDKKRILKVPQEIFYLIKRAKEYFMLTEGAFDITVEPLTEIWGFGPEEGTAPDDQAIEEALQ